MDIVRIINIVIVVLLLSFVTEIYVGGAPSGEFGKLPPPIRSRIGIFGCFGIFDFNGKSTHLIKDALEGGDTVLQGCPGIYVKQRRK